MANLGTVASKRGAMLLDRMMHLETSCLRRLSQGREEVEIRFGRLLRNPRVDVAQIIAGWSEETAPAAAGRHVLAIQDTSEIHFRTTESHRRGLGLIGKGVGRGILLHPMIAVDAASGECLGLVGGALWTRPEPAAVPASSQKKKKRNQQRLLNEKESRHWIETAQAAKPVLAAAATITMIADQEADLDPFWARVPDSNVHVLGRVDHDRKLATGGTLTTAACRWPVLGTRRLTRRKREDRPERAAERELRAGSVTLLRPRGTCDPGLPKQVRLNSDRAQRAQPAGGRRGGHVALAHDPCRARCRQHLANRRLVPKALDYRAILSHPEETGLADRRQPSRDRRLPY